MLQFAKHNLKISKITKETKYSVYLGKQILFDVHGNILTTL